MARYQLISFKTCPWVQRAAIVLREKQVEFEFVHIETGNRPDWFRPISPHGKVPVLRIDEGIALFESNAIAEYLDDVIQPRLHPEDPIARAINRAWTDYIPTFSAALGAVGGAKSAEDLEAALATAEKAFERVEEALRRQGGGPFFNGQRYALVDAGYAPFLQRWLIVEELAGQPVLPKFPRVREWAEALVARPTTHSFAPDIFRNLYLQALERRGSFVAREAVSA